MRRAAIGLLVALSACRASPDVAPTLDASVTDDAATALDAPLPGPDVDDPDVANVTGSFHGRPFTHYDPSLPEVDAIGYEVDLRVDEQGLDGDRYTAAVVGTFVATAPLRALTLDFEGSRVESADVDDRPVTPTRDGGTLTLALPREMAAGEVFRARVRVSGPVAQGAQLDRSDFHAYGGLMAVRPNAVGRPIFLTLDWPSKTRRWLPVRDHPRDGAMIAVRAEFPRAYTVVANGAQESVTDTAAGRAWSFASFTPMPVYDLHVAAYEGWSEASATATRTEAPLRFYTYEPHAAAAAPVYADAAAAMDFYVEHFGPYRWEVARWIEEPIFPGGMEQATAIAMDESLFAPSLTATAREVATHELAHHWAGNLVRVARWNDLWLSEGVTDYLAARFLSEHDRSPAVWRAFFRQAMTQELRGAVAQHALRPPDPEMDPVNLLDAITYKRGALTLRMLEQRVGAASLDRFLRGWFDRYAGTAVTTRDLRDAMRAAFPFADIERFFEQWVDVAGYPLLTVRAAHDPATGAVTVTVTQSQAVGPDGGYAFPLDVDLVEDVDHTTRVRVDVRGSESTATATMAGPPMRVVADPERWSYALVRCESATDCPVDDACRSTTAGRVCMPR